MLKEESNLKSCPKCGVKKCVQRAIGDIHTSFTCMNCGETWAEENKNSTLSKLLRNLAEQKKIKLYELNKIRLEINKTELKLEGLIE